ncbi:MAG: cohesin domain-containing protein [Patescibacteria group bacterium]
MNKAFFIFIVLVLSFTAVSAIEAAGASLYLSPPTGTFFVGSTFDVSIFMNTEKNSINAVQADLRFPAELLQVASPTAGISFVEIWADQPFYSNEEGVISFRGGVPFPGINTSSGLVSTITFRAKAQGRAVISFADSSQILLADGQGTNILKSTGIGEYNLTIKPSEGPKIFSSTHPSLTDWSKNNNPSFYWEKEWLANDFSYVLDQDPQGIPDNISEGDGNSVTLNNITDGVWYFHLKVKKQNTWSGVSNYPVQIDSTPPEAFKVDINGSLAFFSAKDSASGIDYYEVSTLNLSDSKSSASPFFIESQSPYKIPFEAPGKYVILVRVHDQAGNVRESKSTLRVVSPVFSYTERGLRIGKASLPWWLIWACIILLFSAAGFSIYYFFLRKRGLAKTLKREVREAEKEIEDVKEMEGKIHEMRNLEEEAKKESERLAERLRGPKTGNGYE